MSADPFGTRALREVVLAGWAASALRFREDANAEEALALGGYADRALIELVANGVDAAAAAGEPGRVRVTLDAGVLRVANTGAPLTAAGVAGLATLRASAKRDEQRAVGHFGVGFTAVRGLTDAPRIVSRGAGVAFDLAATAAAVAQLSAPALHAEVASRGGQVPALRLPWPVGDEEPGPPDGFTTEVRLPLRAEAIDAVRDQLATLGPWLFFALPGLAELEIEDGFRRLWQRSGGEDGLVRIGDRRFQVAHASGPVPADLLADRPVEERARTRWWLTWVRPLAGPPTGRLGAPTPTDEQVSLPADLYGTFPVDDTRRRLAAGELTDHLLDAAATAYVDLMAAAPVADRWQLIPPDRFPVGPVDGVLRTGILAAAGAAPLLRTALDEPVRPGDAVLVADLPAAAAPLLAQAVPGLLPVPESGAQERALRRLGVGVLSLAEAVAALGGLDRPPAFWAAVYDTLVDAAADALAGLPVPLAGGRLRLGPRGTLLVRAESELVGRVAELVPDLPLVDPAAAHPLLTRLGATLGDAAALLEHPAVRARVADFRAELDDADPDPDEVDALAALALDLAAASGARMREVVLTDADDEPWPADELLAPDAPFATVLDPGADLPQVHPRWSERYPADVLAAVGVRTGLPVTSVAADDVADLPDAADWPGSVTDDAITVIADLDLVDPDRWPAFLALLAADPSAREAVAEPRSYTSWWLRRFAEVGGQPLGSWRRPGPGELVGLYDPLPLDLDPALVAGLGFPATLADAVAHDPDEFLSRYANPGRTVPALHVPAVTAAVVALVRGGADLPDRVRTAAGTAMPADGVFVLDQPWLAQVLPPDEVVPGGADPAVTADVLELDLVSQVLDGVTSAGETGVDDPAVAAAFRALGVDAVALRRAPDLAVRVDGRAVRVTWWSGPAGLVVDGSPEGVGRAVAWAAGRWDARFLAVAAARGEGLAEFG